MTRWMNSVTAAPTAIRWKKISRKKRKKKRRKCRPSSSRNPSRWLQLRSHRNLRVVEAHPSPRANLRRKRRPKRSQCVKSSARSRPRKRNQRASRQRRKKSPRKSRLAKLRKLPERVVAASESSQSNLKVGHCHSGGVPHSRRSQVGPECSTDRALTSHLAKNPKVEHSAMSLRCLRQRRGRSQPPRRHRHHHPRHSAHDQAHAHQCANRPGRT